MDRERRAALKLAGLTVAASAAGVAGCLDSGGDEGDDERTDDADDTNDSSTTTVGPSYTDWLALDADDELVFAYADWRAVGESDDLETAFEDEMGDEEADDESLADAEDLMVAAPVMGGIVAAFGASFGLWGTGLEGIVEVDGDYAADESTDDFESEIDEILLVNDALVFAGAVDIDEVHEALTAEPESEWSFETQFEQTTEISGYAVYEPVDEATASTNDVVAVGADAIVTIDGELDDPIASIRGPLEAKEGDGPTAAEEIDDVAWMLERAADGQLTFGGYGEMDDEDEDENDPEDTTDELGEALEDVGGYVSSLTVQSDRETTGEFAAVFDAIDAETEAKLDEQVGNSADDRQLEIDGKRVTVSATWTEDVLE